MKSTRFPILATALATIALATIGAAHKAVHPPAAHQNSPSTAADSPEPSWIEHKPLKECTTCHAGRSDDSPVELVAPTPQLCYRCHKKYAELKGWKHGPVAMGMCRLCHTPHKSKHQALLAEPIPELCHRCHEAGMLKLVPNHTEQEYRNCGDCHDPHTAPGRMLLKDAFLKTDAGLSYVSQNSAANPRPIFVDRKASLAGLAGVKVTAEVENTELFEEYGITEKLLVSEVEKKLRAGKIAVLPHKEQTEQQSTLHVRLRLMELPSQRRRGRIAGVSGSLNLSLRQKVELLPQYNNPQQRFCTATTWDTDAIVMWGRAQTEGGLKQAVQALITRFSNDYFEANPKGKSPAPME